MSETFEQQAAAFAASGALFGLDLGDSLESNGRIPLASFLNLGPTPCWVRQRLDRNKAHSQSSKGTVQVVVFGSGFVFAHAVVPNPVIAYLAAAPVTTCELGEGFCTAFPQEQES